MSKHQDPEANDALLREILKRLHHMEQRLEELANQPLRHDHYVHIEQTTVHQPVLEQLTFRLDQLQVDELSGTLNIGNNFGLSSSSDPSSQSGQSKQSGLQKAKKNEKQCTGLVHPTKPPKPGAVAPSIRPPSASPHSPDTPSSATSQSEPSLKKQRRRSPVHQQRNQDQDPAKLPEREGKAETAQQTGPSGEPRMTATDCGYSVKIERKQTGGIP
ncbi:hypothetical protein LOK74_03145 [Brevibacillus humidisoli]|uniref:hypothetical protein n=1 Tax=Brevibacillus humidisoli TaxID=2895522 RepID=UPI001E30D33A|nr:hypothetical protein [Brevibacillus humidisoli]UFJ41544.1 hypothetical protein LOK74_03145 [Brevibacillus humidisoli]